METNSVIKNDYYSLVKDINSGNKFRDEKTRMLFSIQKIENSWELYATLDNRKILLCLKISDWKWEPYNSKYPDLTAFIAEILQYKIEFENLTSLLLSFIFKLPN